MIQYSQCMCWLVQVYEHVHIHVSAHVSPSLRTLESHWMCWRGTINMFLKRQQRQIFKKKRTTQVWDDSVHFLCSETEPAYTCLINQRLSVQLCWVTPYGWNKAKPHMGIRAKLTLPDGQLGEEGEEGGRGVRQAGCGDVHRCWIGNSLLIIISTLIEKQQQLLICVSTLSFRGRRSLIDSSQRTQTRMGHWTPPANDRQH